MKFAGRLFALSTLTLALYGCGGGSGGGPTGGNALEQGRAQLTRVAGGEQPSSEQNLQTILDLFNAALSTTPDTPEAHFGAAVCLTGIVAQQTEAGVSSSGSGSSGGSSGSIGMVPPSPPAPPGGAPETPVQREIPSRSTLGLFWNLDRGLADPLTLMRMLAPITDLRFGLMPFYGYSSDVPDRRLQMLTQLQTVVQHLQQVEATPGFTSTLPSPYQHDKTVTVGLPEVYLFHAYVESLRTELALSLAYVRDAGLPPPPPVTTLPEISLLYHSPQYDRNQDGKLTPDEYLPPSPFLTLRDSSLLQTAQQAMQSAADVAKKGVEGVLARPANNTSFLIANTAEMQRTLTEMRDQVLPLLKQAAIGPVTIEMQRYQPIPMLASPNGALPPTRPAGATLFAPDIWPGDQPPSPPVNETERIKINLAAWFARPPADLKTLAPAYPLDEHGWPRFDQATYADLTFAGLFPDGLPASLR